MLKQHFLLQRDYPPRSVKVFHFYNWNINMATMVTDWLKFIETVESESSAPIIIHSAPRYDVYVHVVCVREGVCVSVSNS